MWKQRSDHFINALTLTRRQDQLEQRIERRQREIKELADLAQSLFYEPQRAADREAYERRMLLLEIENRLLKEKLQLPPQNTRNKEDEEDEE